MIIPFLAVAIMTGVMTDNEADEVYKSVAYKAMPPTPSAARKIIEDELMKVRKNLEVS